MTYTVEMDSEGKVQVPEPFRSAYHLRPGSRVVIADAGDQASGARMLLSPAEEYEGLRLVQGAWVIDDDRPVSSQEIERQIEEDRSEREARISSSEARSSAQ